MWAKLAPCLVSLENLRTERAYSETWQILAAVCLYVFEFMLMRAASSRKRSIWFHLNLVSTREQFHIAWPGFHTRVENVNDMNLPFRKKKHSSSHTLESSENWASPAKEKLSALLAGVKLFVTCQIEPESGQDFAQQNRALSQLTLDTTLSVRLR